MGDWTEHFSQWEFECHGDQCCGHSAPMVREQIDALEELWGLLREEYGEAFKGIGVNSGFRCMVHNREVGSDDTSVHPRGEGSDIVAAGVAPCSVARLAKKVPAFNLGGIGIYPWGNHVDVRRNGPARWRKT